jgi:hypothetical protein
MDSLPRKREQLLGQEAPLILLGMHRSGTSLMVRLLTRVGFHMGSWLSRDAESVHFQRINRRIYGAAGSKWGDVGSVIRAMRTPSFVEEQTRVARRALFQEKRFPWRQTEIERFFGRDLWSQIERGAVPVWGWKDPRTTLVFPIWLNLFPNARCLHILRNGIDVAISIHRRSLKQQRKLRNRLLTIDYSPATLDFNYSFQLWESYVTFVLDHRDLVAPDRFLQVRYEDLLAHPTTVLEQVTRFAGQSVDGDRLRLASQMIDRSRRDNRAYANAYQSDIPALANRPLMQALGYSYPLDGKVEDVQS